MAGNRTRARDVTIWDLNNNENRIPLGGLILTAGVTNTYFRQMLDVQNEHGDGVL